MNWRKWMGIMMGCACCAGIQTGQAQVEWTAGHGDIGIGYDSLDGLEPHWHIGEDDETVVLDGVSQSFGPSGTEYEPDELIAVGNRVETRPASPTWDFIGVTAGTDFYVFPQTEDPNVPFVGIGMEELVPADWTGDITLTLTGISGTGVTNGGFFSLYTTDSFGTPTQLMATDGGISAADAVSQTPGSHEHYNWAFTELGLYDLTFDVTGTHATDGAQTATATYTFNAIPEPSSMALFGLGLGALMASRRRTK